MRVRTASDPSQPCQVSTASLSECGLSHTLHQRQAGPLSSSPLPSSSTLPPGGDEDTGVHARARVFSFACAHSRSLPFFFLSLTCVCTLIVSMSSGADPPPSAAAPPPSGLTPGGGGDASSAMACSGEEKDERVLLTRSALSHSSRNLQAQGGSRTLFARATVLRSPELSPQ